MIFLFAQQGGAGGGEAECENFENRSLEAEHRSGYQRRWHTRREVRGEKTGGRQRSGEKTIGKELRAGSTKRATVCVLLLLGAGGGHSRADEEGQFAI